MEKKNVTETIYIASLVLGICSILFCTIPLLGMILSIVSIIISLKARKKLKQKNENKGIVTAGIVLSIISLILACIITILVIVIPIGGSSILNVTDIEEVNVPNVVGLTVEEAQEKVESVGLKFEIDKKEFSNDIENGYVISQSPPYFENYKVKQGSIIEVIVSEK